MPKLLLDDTNLVESVSESRHEVIDFLETHQNCHNNIFSLLFMALVIVLVNALKNGKTPFKM